MNAALSTDDLDRAAEAAVFGAFSNGGQTCVGVERVYVHRDVYRRFLEIVADKATNERFHKDLSVGTYCRNFCFENGLVMRAVGDSMIVAPPLVITREQVDELVEKAWRCLDLTAAWVADAA